MSIAWRDDTRYVRVIDNSDPSVTYFGEALSGYGNTAGKALAVWRIWIVDTDGNLLYADGIGGARKTWDDRASYTYK